MVIDKGTASVWPKKKKKKNRESDRLLELVLVSKSKSLCLPRGKEAYMWHEVDVKARRCIERGEQCMFCKGD